MFEAVNHLEVLGLHEFGVYLVKPESPHSKVKAKNILGPFAKVSDQLAEFNRQGYAVFVQVQGGIGRGDKFIKQVRWIYVDLDIGYNRGWSVPELPFPAHLVVRTPRGLRITLVLDLGELQTKKPPLD